VADYVICFITLYEIIDHTLVIMTKIYVEHSFI
jgi:hypothetical protein